MTNFKQEISNYNSQKARHKSADRQIQSHFKSSTSSFHYKSGQIMVIAIIFLGVTLILSTSIFGNLAQFVRLGSNSILREQAIDMAESGVNEAIWQLNKSAGAYTGEVNTKVGTTGSFTVTITNKTQTLKTITATGYVPNNSQPRAKQTIKVDAQISTQTISFRYAVQAGDSVTMRNSSTINGTLYANGNITGSNSSKITGDAYAGGTISSPDPTVLGTEHPNSPIVPLPSMNYQQWKNFAAAGGTTTCSPTCNITTSGIIGPQQFNGNLTISNNAIITMLGPIYVTGNFSMSLGGTTLQLDNSFGSNSTVLIIDGIANLTQGGSFQPTNANPKGYITLVSTSTDPHAIQISQSGATAIFYSLDGGAFLSQSAHLTALVAKELEMDNSATLDYDSGLAGAQFSTCSTCPGASWTIEKGTYRFTSGP